MARSQHRSRASKQDYGTPANVIRAVKKILGIVAFTHDFAASATNTKAETFFSREDDALSYGPSEWAERSRDGWGWLNPEFRAIPKFAAMALEASRQGGHIAMLVPAGVGSNWFRDSVHGKARVIFLNGRITFDGTPPNPKTGKPDPYPKDCMLVLFGADPGYEVWKWEQDA